MWGLGGRARGARGGAGWQPYHLWGLRGPTPPVPSFGLWPNDRPGGHRPPSYFLCEQKVTKKSLEPGVPDLPLGAALWSRRLGGGLTGDWVESLMDWMPREQEVLRASDLGAWWSTNSACRPFKGAAPSTGNALLQIRSNLQKGARTSSCGACQRGTAVCSPRYWHYPENTPK